MTVDWLQAIKARSTDPPVTAAGQATPGEDAEEGFGDHVTAKYEMLMAWAKRQPRSVNKVCDVINSITSKCCVIATIVMR